jgi:hypothetical protein
MSALVKQLALTVIERFSASNRPLDIYLTFWDVAKGKIRPESNGYFFRKVRKQVFKWLNTDQESWVSWPKQARQYLGIPEAPPPQPRLVVLRKQEELPL